MGLSNAINDVVRFTQADFAVDLVFTAPTAETADVKGLASKHRISVNPDTGLTVNAPNVHVSVVESVLTDLSYPTRNAKGEVFLKDHLVLYNGKTYKVSESFPDETLGLIVCILDDYAV